MLTIQKSPPSHFCVDTLSFHSVVGNFQNNGERVSADVQWNGSAVTFFFPSQYILLYDESNCISIKRHKKRFLLPFLFISAILLNIINNKSFYYNAT